MKINLCSGAALIDGYVNVDIEPLAGVDIVMDVRELAFDEECAEQVVWFHGIEHLPLNDACALLRKIFRWLKPGGHLLIEGPDVGKAVRNANDGDFEMIRSIFGDELRLGKRHGHQWGWTGALLQQELASAGYIVAPLEDGISHEKPLRDYRVTGFKPKMVHHGL